jgi:hypothetical protein
MMRAVCEVHSTNQTEGVMSCVSIAASIAVLAVGVSAAQSSEPGGSALGSPSTVTGCLYRQHDLSSASAGSVLPADAYVLVKPPIPGATGPSPESSPARGSESLRTSAYRLDVVADRRLPTLVGSRVEVTGQVRASTDPGALPQIEVSSIRQVEGVCPPAGSSQPR